MTLKYKIYLEKFKIVRDYGVLEIVCDKTKDTIALFLLNIMIWTVIISALMSLIEPNVIVIVNEASADIEDNSLSVPRIGDVVQTVSSVQDTSGGDKINSEAQASSSHVEALIREIWGDDSEVGYKIAMCESRLNPKAHGDKNLMYWKNGKQYGDSIGVFQVRTFENRPSRDELFEEKFNIKYAYEIFKARGGYQWAWCYENRVLTN